MNGCEYYQELISRMLDEDLSRSERAELAKHLETCSECAAMYQAFSVLSDTISSDMAEPPEDLVDNIMADIRRNEIVRKNRGRMPRQFRTLIAAAACAAVMIAAVGGTAIVKSRRADNAVYEARSSHIASGTISAADSAEASVEAPAAVTGQPAAQAEEPAAQSLPDDDNNVGYVPSRSTPEPAAAAATPAPSVDLSQYPVYTPAPAVTPAPTPAPTPTPTPVPTPVPAATPELSEGVGSAVWGNETDLDNVPAEKAPESDSDAPMFSAAAAPSDNGDGLQAPSCSAGDAGSADTDENIERHIDLRSIDVSELVPRLLGTDKSSEKDDGTGAEAAAEPTATPAVTPPAKPSEPVSSAAPIKDADGNVISPVVSTPAPMSEHLKSLLPEWVIPDTLDIISCNYLDEEVKLIVCIKDDKVLVFTISKENVPTAHTPSLTGEQYSELIAPYITLAEEEAEKQLSNP